MSWGNRFPDGFVANYRFNIEGNIPDKTWKSFRTKFLKQNAPGWACSKLYDKYSKSFRVDVRTTDVNHMNAVSKDTLDLIVATLSLLAVKEL